MRMTPELKSRYTALARLLSEIEGRKVPVSELVEKASRIGLPALEAEAQRLKEAKEHQAPALAETAGAAGSESGPKPKPLKKYPPFRRK